MANYPQELAQDAVCQCHTGHMTGLWFLPSPALRLITNEWITHKVKRNNWFKTRNFRFQLTWTNETFPAARRLSAERSIHPLLDSSEFSISRNLTIAQLAASVDWLDARRRISDTIRRDTCWQNARMSRNFSIISDDGLFPNTCNAVQLHHVFYFSLCHITLLVPHLCNIFL